MLIEFSIEGKKMQSIINILIPKIPKDQIWIFSILRNYSYNKIDSTVHG
jgi:hypothetical protein